MKGRKRYKRMNVYLIYCYEKAYNKYDDDKADRGE